MAATTDHSRLFQALEEGITRLTSSDAWRRHLAFQSRFHRYSYGNVLLIAAQNDGATRVAGFATWRRLNRFVRKGEKAIWILAPMVGRVDETDEGDRVLRGFRYVPVFDIAQTDGEDPPTVCRELSGGDPSHVYGQLVAVAQSIGFRVEDHAFGGAAHGDCSMTERRVRIETGNSPAQRVKTLAHEIAHALLHERMGDRALAELEAESTAFVVCRHIGLDTGGYSFGYVAAWAGGGAQAVLGIKASCGRIQKAASVMLDFLTEGPESAASAGATGYSATIAGAGRTR